MLKKSEQDLRVSSKFLKLIKESYVYRFLIETCYYWRENYLNWFILLTHHEGQFQLLEFSWGSAIKNDVAVW